MFALALAGVYLVWAFTTLFVSLIPLSLLICLMSMNTFRNTFSAFMGWHGYMLFRLLCLGYGVTVNVHWLNERRPRPRESFVIISNHQSPFDIPLVYWVAYEIKCYFGRWISKREIPLLFRVVAWIVHSGFLSRKEEEKYDDRRSVQDCAACAAPDGAWVAIFPEGSRFVERVLSSGYTRVRPPRPKGVKILLDEMYGAGVLSVTVDWQGRSQGVAFGRTILDGADLVGGHLTVHLEFVPREMIDGGEWTLDKDWRKKDELLTGG
jgi:1-acyl-sn-glycerol-3-phosphate acyltransferase